MITKQEAILTINVVIITTLTAGLLLHSQTLNTIGLVAIGTKIGFWLHKYIK